MIKWLTSQDKLEIELEPEELDPRPMLVRHSERVDLLIARLETEKAEKEKQIASLQEEVRELGICISAFKAAANKLAAHQPDAEPSFEFDRGS